MVSRKDTVGEARAAHARTLAENTTAEQKMSVAQGQQKTVTDGETCFTELSSPVHIEKKNCRPNIFSTETASPLTAKNTVKNTPDHLGRARDNT